jgi:hypothetical protein
MKKQFKLKKITEIPLEPPKYQNLIESFFFNNQNLIESYYYYYYFSGLGFLLMPNKQPN